MPNAQTLEPLDSKQIEEVLLGNSILHPSFGCVFYKDKTTAVLHSNSGVISEYSWRTEGGKYFSTGSCEAIGCTLKHRDKIVEFFRTDEGYYRKTQFAKGNACEQGKLVT